MPLPPDRSHVSTEQQAEQPQTPLDQLTAPDLVRQLAADQHAAVTAVEVAADDIGRFVSELVERMRIGGRLIYLGAGTSGRLGVLDASECPPTFGSAQNQVVGLIAGGDSSLRRSSEAKEDNPNGAASQLEELGVGAGDTVLGIAAGGTTPWVLGAITLAKARGAATALLSCSPRSQPSGCDRLIVVHTGPELLRGSTRLKAGTATKITLNAITTATFVLLGAVHGDLMIDVKVTNDKLLDRAIRIMRAFTPDLSRQDAADQIKACGGQLKTAILAAHCDLDAEAASCRLAAHNGSLRRAIATQ
jgi:N-acetylmuramic acid 6-phosphate etherase